MEESIPICANRSGDRRLLATGLSRGEVRLYNYPALKNARGIQELGHSGEVANCRFSLDDETLVTIGKNDRAILVWRLRGGGGGKKPANEDKGEEKKD